MGRVIADFETGPAVLVEDRAALPSDRAQLTSAEHEALEAADFGPAREREWIAGRVAAHRALRFCLGAAADDLSVLSELDGAPRVVGREDLAISLSHDDAAVAVAVSAGIHRRVAVDICARDRGARVAALLVRLGLPANTLDACVTWAALECALKLQQRSVWSLLDARPRVRECDGALDVDLGCGNATVSFALTPTHAIAWSAQ